MRAAPSTVWLFLDRRGITFKKDGARLRAAAPDVLRRRLAWFDGQLDLDPCEKAHAPLNGWCANPPETTETTRDNAKINISE
ncbi:hypothetical protein [Chelativorans sp. AA-79]|uniref:hypothetical protein n=1 Tax=Chelativorans sp. AA-79 TaxID=3028735 RepID=UPI0023F63A62|nr:hypothetical protein [Chelativorans sp. AA-79]WEX07518.1 hypothetical protein PVE73_15490 [Chelativorans sp. AA-79]